jgi:hypothetical protein
MYVCPCTPNFYRKNDNVASLKNNIYGINSETLLRLSSSGISAIRCQRCDSFFYLSPSDLRFKLVPTWNQFLLAVQKIVINLNEFEFKLFMEFDDYEFNDETTI